MWLPFVYNLFQLSKQAKHFAKQFTVILEGTQIRGGKCSICSSGVSSAAEALLPDLGIRQDTQADCICCSLRCPLSS